MNVNGEQEEEVRNQGELDTQPGVGEQTEEGGEVWGEQRHDEHHIGHPEVDVVQEEVAKSLTEHRVQLEARWVLHHPDDEALEVPDDHLHAEKDGVCHHNPVGYQGADLRRDQPSEEEVQHQREEAEVGRVDQLTKPPGHGVHGEAVGGRRPERLQLLQRLHRKVGVRSTFTLLWM